MDHCGLCVASVLTALCLSDVRFPSIFEFGQFHPPLSCSISLCPELRTPSTSHIVSHWPMFWPDHAKKACRLQSGASFALTVVRAARGVGSRILCRRRLCSVCKVVRAICPLFVRVRVFALGPEPRSNSFAGIAPIERKRLSVQYNITQRSRRIAASKLATGANEGSVGQPS